MCFHPFILSDTELQNQHEEKSPDKKFSFHFKIIS